MSKYISVLVLALVVLACGRDKNKPGFTFMDDMYRSPALKAYEASSQFENGQEAQLPVAGSIPRNYDVYEFEDTPAGYELAKAELSMPAEFMGEENLQEGKELYGIFCIHCHGDKGDGQGHLVKIEKFPPVPAYDSRDLTPGSMYHVIMYGKGLMGSHASQLNYDERWKIVRYVQELRGDKVEMPAEESAEEMQVSEETTDENN